MACLFSRTDYGIKSGYDFIYFFRNFKEIPFKTSFHISLILLSFSIEYVQKLLIGTRHLVSNIISKRITSNLVRIFHFLHVKGYVSKYYVRL